MYNSDIMYAVMRDRAVQLQHEARLYRETKSVSKHRRRLVSRRSR